MAGRGPAGGCIVVGVDTRRPPVHRLTLWVAMAAVLGASWAHVARVFGTLEESGPPAFLASLGPATAVLAALGLDLGLISLAWAIGQRRRLGRAAGDLWAAVGVFAALSAFANADAALGVTLGAAPTWAAVAALDGWTLARVVLLAAALPALALWLSRVVELDAEAGADVAGDDAPVSRQSQGGHKPRRRRPGPDDLADLVAARPTIDVAAAARALGVTRPTVYAWAGALGLERDAAGVWSSGRG